MILAKQKLRKNGNSIMLPDREGTENIRLRNNNTEGLQMNEYQTLTVLRRYLTGIRKFLFLARFLL